VALLLQYRHQQHVLETSNVEKVVTDAFHGVEQLIDREKAIPAVNALVHKLHGEIREAKVQLSSSNMKVSNYKDSLQSLQVGWCSPVPGVVVQGACAPPSSVPCIPCTPRHTPCIHHAHTLHPMHPRHTQAHPLHTPYAHTMHTPCTPCTPLVEGETRDPIAARADSFVCHPPP
jgi:hypothetical protein